MYSHGEMGMTNGELGKRNGIWRLGKRVLGIGIGKDSL